MNGKRANENTVRILADYLVIETGLPEFTFRISEQSVKAAKEYMRFARLDGVRSLTRSFLGHYAGVYCLSGYGGSPVSLTMIIDHETYQNVLLVRGILRVTGAKWPPIVVEFLEGFAIPEPQQLVIVLRHPLYGASHTIQVPDTDHALKHPVYLPGGLDQVRLPARVQFPETMNGKPQTDPYQPTKYYIENGRSISQVFIRYEQSDVDNIDLFRDTYQLTVGGLLAEVEPVPYDIFDKT